MNKHTITIPVAPREADFLSQANLITFFMYVLDSSGYASHDKEYSVDNLNKMGFTWVLSRFAMEIFKYPKMYSTIKIDTWIEDIGAIVSTRNFRVYDESGEVIAQATSYWSMINLQTRRPVNLLDSPFKDAPINPEKNDMSRPAKILEIKGEKASETTVKCSDIDFNIHTNSARYVKWQIDTYSLDDFKDRQIKRFDINYLQEALYGETIEVFKEERGNEHYFDLKNANGRSICKTILTWEDKK